jgi:hypothetical protein
MLLMLALASSVILVTDMNVLCYLYGIVFTIDDHHTFGAAAPVRLCCCLLRTVLCCCTKRTPQVRGMAAQSMMSR